MKSYTELDLPIEFVGFIHNERLYIDIGLMIKSIFYPFPN